MTLTVLMAMVGRGRRCSGENDVPAASRRRGRKSGPVEKECEVRDGRARSLGGPPAGMAETDLGWPFSGVGARSERLPRGDWERQHHRPPTRSLARCATPAFLRRPPPSASSLRHCRQPRLRRTTKRLQPAAWRRRASRCVFRRPSARS